MKTTKMWSTLATALLSMLLVGGCDNSPSQTAAPAKPTVGILLYKKDDVYISLVSSALQRIFADKATVIVQSADSDQMTQNEQVVGMIEKKVSALAVNLVETQAAADVLDKAKKAGIPVVFFNREPDLGVIKTYAKSSFVGTAQYEAGVMQGNLIKQLWDAHPEYDRNKDGICQYVMFQGNPDNPEALARTEYSVRQARSLGVDMRQVGETHVCNWDEALAREAMKLVLMTDENKIELVIANSDAMALGAIAALAERGYNKEGGDPAKFIPVIGVDATPQAIEAIRKGVMSATVKQDGEAMAHAIAALTLNAINGKPFLSGTSYAWDVSGVAIRIPYSPYLDKH